MDQNFKTPILFIIFNRPDTTKRVFEEIKKLKPAKLYIAADGPRKNKDGEREVVEKTRKMVLDMIDWDCEIKNLFREENLGCKIAVSSAIDWFFDQVEEGIILEDDCLPNPSFFNYCSELLEKYRDDERIMIISGDNFQNGIIRGDGSYYFSKSVHIWGWATWRRAWKKYDVDMKTYPSFKEQNKIKTILNNVFVRKYHISIFDAVFCGKIDTWDYQWTYAVWSNNGLCIIPNVNLISNIGFGDDATHTKGKNNKVANMKTVTMGKIIHSDVVKQNLEADESFYRKSYSPLDYLFFLIKQILQ